MRASAAEDDVRETGEVDQDVDGDGDHACTELPSAFDLALAIGFQLKATADCWKRCCSTSHVAPLALWEHLPGFGRLQKALALAETASFTPEGFVRWRNALRAAGKPPLTRAPLSAESTAADIEQAFRKAAGWWSGDASMAVRRSP